MVLSDVTSCSDLTFHSDLTSRSSTPSTELLIQYDELMATLLREALAIIPQILHAPIDGSDHDDASAPKPMTKAEKQKRKKKRRKERERFARAADQGGPRCLLPLEEAGTLISADFRLYSFRPVQSVSLLPSTEDFPIPSYAIPSFKEPDIQQEPSPQPSRSPGL